MLLPGESQGRGSLVGCHLWGRTESDTLKRLSSSSSISEPGTELGPFLSSCGRQRQAGRDLLKASRPENYLLLLASVSPPENREGGTCTCRLPSQGQEPDHRFAWGWQVWRPACTVLTLEVFGGLLAAVCPSARETHPPSPRESHPRGPEWLSPGQALETQERF